MRLAPIDHIVVLPTRQRRSFDPLKMEELRSSIERTGLLSPICVRPSGADVPWILVYGERRLRAVRDLHDLNLSFKHEGVKVASGLIPIVAWSELNELEAEEAELDENIKRDDITWQERAGAVSRLQKLREAQGRPATVAVIAEETYQPKRDGFGATNAIDVTRKTLIVARHLDKPQVAAAKTLDEGFKILKGIEEVARNTARAAEVGKTLSSASHQLENANALDWLLECPADSFDIILTDPPYGIDASDFGDAGGRLITQVHHYDDSYERWQDLIRTFIMESFRVAKREAHAYICCDFDRFHEIKGYMSAAGWTVFRTPIINYKRDGNRVPRPFHGPQRKWELILYAIKGDKQVTKVYPDVIETRGDENLGHGAQKPIGLYLDLLRRSCIPGDRVLDCFCGTGTIFPAAHELKLYATGVELDPAAYGIAAKRLQELK